MIYNAPCHVEDYCSGYDKSVQRDLSPTSSSAILGIFYLFFSTLKFFANEIARRDRWKFRLLLVYDVSVIKRKRKRPRRRRANVKGLEEEHALFPRGVLISLVVLRVLRLIC